MTTKIYGGYQSWTRDVRARWLLDEVGASYELVQLDVFGGDQRKPEYLAVHPLGKVPFLTDDASGVAMFESGAILAWLAETHAPELVPPAGTPERAEYLQWLFYSAATLETPIVKVFANRYLFPDAPGAAERAVEGANELAVHARLLSERLNGRQFLVGERFTAADIMIGTALIWAEKAGALVGYPVLRGYLQRLTARPAARKALAPTAREFDRDRPPAQAPRQ
jgi:glutathione S-transferase